MSLHTQAQVSKRACGYKQHSTSTLRMIQCIGQHHRRMSSQMVSTFGSCAYPGVDLMRDQVAQNLGDRREVALKLLHELATHLWRLKLLLIFDLQASYC